MRAVIRLIIFALILHATWRTATVYWRHHQFKDGIQQTAQFGSGRSEAELIQQVREIGKAYEIPLSDDSVNARVDNTRVVIDASYVSRIEILPRYFYPWRFAAHVDAFTIVPKEAAP